jgi:diguanylate cyclase (GGDEF)-like protein
MLDSVERDDIPADVQATPGPGEGSPRDLLRRLLPLHAAQETHALADALASLAAAHAGSATACAFVDDGSGLLTPLLGQQQALPGLADIRLSSTEPGPVAEVLSRGEMVVSDNLEDVLGVEVSGLTFRRTVLCRLAWEGETLGVVLFCDQGDVDLELYLRLADHVSLALVHLRTLKRTYRFGGIDPAQWMFDREWLTLRLEEEVERAKRYGRPLGLLLFRFLNLDRLTEAAGSQQTGVFLRRVAAIIRGQIRTPDILAGYGDASIAVLLPETERAPAIATQERIASHLRQLQPTGAAGTDWTPDLRLGMASHPHDGDKAADLLTVAEAELEQGDEPQQPLKKTA